MNQLIYNSETGRLELDGEALHSGDGLTVLTVDETGRPAWIDTRIEYNHSRKQWYLVGLPGIQPAGLFARL